MYHTRFNDADKFDEQAALQGSFLVSKEFSLTWSSLFFNFNLRASGNI